MIILERSRSTRQRKRRRNNRIDHHYQRERHGDTLSPCWAEGIAIDSCQRLSRPSSAPAGATPTLLGQRRVRGTDRSLRDATHSHNDITAKMPRKMPNRTIASLLRSSLVIEESLCGHATPLLSLSAARGRRQPPKSGSGSPCNHPGRRNWNSVWTLTGIPSISIKG